MFKDWEHPYVVGAISKRQSLHRSKVQAEVAVHSYFLSFFTLQLVFSTPTKLYTPRRIVPLNENGILCFYTFYAYFNRNFLPPSTLDFYRNELSALRVLYLYSSSVILVSLYNL